MIACSDRETGISIVDTGSGSVLAVFSRGPNSKVSKMAWSPLGSYLVAWERWAPGLENLAVWSVGAPEAPVATFSQKNPPTPETWPTVQWTADEAVAAHVVTNEVHFYAGSDVGGQRITKLRVEGLRGFSLSPGTPQYRVSIYKPEHKGSPAQIRMYHCESKSNPAPGPIAHNGPRSLRAHVHVPACAHVVCGLRGSIPMCLCARPCAAAATLSAQPLDIPQPLDISLTAGPCAGRRP